MSNEIYPQLPGLAYGVKRRPMWRTDVRTTPSQREYRSSDQTLPRRRISLVYEYLQQGLGAAEQETLEGFFNRHHGELDSFLLNDPDDNACTNQLFGVGNGVTTQFQLVRTRGGFVEPIPHVNNVASISRAGVVLTPGSGYTVSATGLVTLATAPTAGQQLTWTGSYYWRARFDGQDLDFEKFLDTLWKLGKVDLLTTRS